MKSRFASSSTARPPRANDLYWRGPSLTHFNGRTWSMMQGTRRGERVLETVEYRGEPTSYRVMLEPNGRNWAFALDMPREWTGDNRCAWAATTSSARSSAARACGASTIASLPTSITARASR